MSYAYLVEPIGFIRSPLKTLHEAPKMGSESGVTGELVVFGRYREAFLGLEAGQKIVILYWMDRADRDCLRVHPRADRSRPIRGVFSTRSPDRPNPIAMDTVEIVKVEGVVITVRGVDALDGTPLLDIKATV